MRPLTRWRIRASRLPERLTEDAPFDTSFRLPGADALSAFADLLGGMSDEPGDDAQTLQEADFTLPAAIPDDINGAVELTVELDFGALCADDAELTLELVRGRGRVLADDMPLCTFQNPKDGFLRVPLTRALHAGRRQTIRLCFDVSRPAGVLGPVNLHLMTCARLRDIVLLPDAKTQTVRLRATLAAMETGRYVLRARAACKGDAWPVHDLPISLTAGEPQTVEMTLPLPGKPFVPGQPADGPSICVQLLRQGRNGALCDETTLLCGYSGQPASYDIPLLPSECLDPDALLARIGRMRLFGVRLDAPAPDCFYRTMTLAGVSVLHPFATEAMRARLSRHACVSFGDAPLPRMRSLPALDAWLLCGLTACPRTPPADASPAELLFEAAGRELDAQSPNIAAVLLWLRAVRVRLLAEAARQNRFSGALCPPGVWQDADVFAALQTALAPTHVSVLPLCGAWFAGSTFNASVCAFVDEQDADGDLIVRAWLEDDDGHHLASLKRPCPPHGGEIGLLTCALPNEACVLTLCASLSKGGETIEQNQIPVYVGVKGMLEAAF
mgnify:FL=1